MTPIWQDDFCLTADGLSERRYSVERGPCVEYIAVTEERADGEVFTMNKAPINERTFERIKELFPRGRML